MTTKLLIVDDHEIIRVGLKHMITEKANDRIFMILEAESIADAKETILLHRPDIILTDYSLKDGTSNTLVEWLIEKKLRIPAIALSNYAERSFFLSMTSAGVKGYLLKDIESYELAMAIEIVLKGGQYYSSNIKKTDETGIPQHLVSQAGVTKRELEILKLMMEQLTTDEISKQLYLSKRTVETHRYRLLKKFKVKNSISLVKTVLLQKQ